MSTMSRCISHTHSLEFQSADCWCQTEKLIAYLLEDSPVVQRLEYCKNELPVTCHDMVLCLLCSITWAIWTTCVLETTVERWTVFIITMTAVRLSVVSLCLRPTGTSWPRMTSRLGAIDMLPWAWQRHNSDLVTGQIITLLTCLFCW